MKERPGRDPSRAMLQLKPRYGKWVGLWLMNFGFQGLANFSALRLFGVQLPWLYFCVNWLILSAVALSINIWRERLSKPRRYSYWDDGAGTGATIRHSRTGEVLIHIEGEKFRAEELRGVSLEEADLRGEKLDGIELPGLCLRGANLQGASLTSANLEGATLAGCQLGGARLQRANLRGADLRGAQFGRYGLSLLRNADFKGARYNAATRWPGGFRPDHFDCIYEPDADQVLPIPSGSPENDGQNLPVIAVAASPEKAVVEVRA